MHPSTNLGVQTAIIANARAFVGTYGGYAYLAPFFGVHSTSFYSRTTFKRHHLDLCTPCLRASWPGTPLCDRCPSRQRRRTRVWNRDVQRIRPRVSSSRSTVSRALRSLLVECRHDESAAAGVSYGSSSTCQALDLAQSRPRVQPFDVALFADTQWRGHVDQDK